MEKDYGKIFYFFPNTLIINCFRPKKEKKTDKVK